MEHLWIMVSQEPIIELCKCVDPTGAALSLHLKGVGLDEHQMEALEVDLFCEECATLILSAAG